MLHRVLQSDGRADGNLPQVLKPLQHPEATPAELLDPDEPVLQLTRELLFDALDVVAGHNRAKPPARPGASGLLR